LANLWTNVCHTVTGQIQSVSAAAIPLGTRVTNITS